jgi:hypothetical protein
VLIVTTQEILIQRSYQVRRVRRSNLLEIKNKNPFQYLEGIFIFTTFVKRKVKGMKNKKKNIVNLFRSKKIESGDLVYNRVPLEKFDEFHLFKVVKINVDIVDLESRNGTIVRGVKIGSLKRSDLMNKN